MVYISAGTYSVSRHRECSSRWATTITGNSRYADNASDIKVPPAAPIQCHSREKYSFDILPKMPNFAK